MSKAGITVAIKGEINDLEAKINQSKEIINEATKQIIAENNKLKASQDSITEAQKTYAKEIASAKDEIKKYIEIKSQNGKLTKEEQKNLAAAKAELALYKIKTNELIDVEKQRQQEIRKTINASKELSNIQRASIADSRLEIDTKRKIIAMENEVANSKDKTEKSTSNLANTTIRYLRWAGTIAGVVYAGKRAWDATVGSGIAVNKIIENNTYGIAALISANTQMVDSFGKTLSPIEKFTMGQTHAKKVIAELRTESTKTAATFPQLLEIFQQGIGKTLSMGDAFGATTEDIEKNTIKLASRMSNFANAIGMPMDRVKEEMRSLVSGNASTDSLISTIIFGSPGEANKAIKEAEGKVNGVAELLDRKFKPFDILADTKTFDKSVLAVQDAWSRAMGDMVEKSGAFKDITNIFYEMSKDITTNTDSIVKSFDSIYESSKLIVSVLDDIAIAGAVFFVGGKLDNGLSSVSKFFKASEVAAVGLEAIVLRLTLGAEALRLAFLGLIAANPFTALAVAGTAAFPVFSAINDEIIKMQHGGKTQAEFNAQIKAQEDKWTSLDETHARITKNIEERTKRQQALQKAVGIYEGQGLDATKLKTELSKVTKELEDYNTALESINPYKQATEQVAKFTADQKQAGQLIANRKIDTERMKEDEKDLLNLQGNIAKYKDEITKKEKIRADVAIQLKKAEEAQAQAVKLNGQENISIAADIATYKKDIQTQDKLIAESQRKINEENQKDSEQSFRKAEAKVNKEKEQNKQLAEQSAIRSEIQMYLSGNIDTEKLAIEQQRIKIAGLNEEYAKLTDKASQEKVLLEILKEQYSYNDKIAKAAEKEQKQYKFDQISGGIKYADMQNLGEVYQELLVYYKEDPESLADLQTWVEREQNKLSKKPLVIDIRLEGWDEVSNSIATFGNSFQDINKAQKKYQQENQKAKKDEVELAQARVNLRDTTMSGIADMTGAVASFYDEDDDRRKKQLELQKVFYGAKMAMQIAEMTQSTAFTSLFITQEAVKSTAAATTAVATAAASSPWTGFATAAAMIALMASLGIMIGGKTTTTTTISSDNVSSQSANTGTGSVLGDTAAQSESISESLSILEEYAKPEFRLSQQMAASLQSIDSKIGGVSALLVQSGGFAFGAGFTPKASDTGWKGLGVSYQGISDKLTNKVEDLFSSVLGDTIGGIAGKIFTLPTKIGTKALNSIIGGIFGKSSTTSSTKLTDSGIYFADQLLGNAVDEIYGSMYQTIQKKTTTTSKSWFKSSITTKKKITTYFEDMSGFTETERQFSLVLSSLYNSVELAAQALGKNSELMENKLDNFIVSIGKISLKGLSGTQIQETLTAVFGKIGDQLATTAFPELVEFQSIGEGLFTTLTRVASGIEQADYYTDRLGKTFEKISYTDILNKQGNVGFEALYQSIIKADEALYGVDNNLVQIVDTLSGTAEELYETYRGLDLLRSSIKFMGVEASALSFASIKGAGGIEQLSTGVNDYLENFLTDSEKLAFQTQLIKEEFTKLNLTMPTSKDGFKNLVTSLQMTSEADEELYGRLIILSKGFAEVADESEKFYEESISKITDIQSAFLDLIGVIDTTINNLLGKQTGNNTTESTISNYLQKRQQVDVLLGKGSNLTETELSSLNTLVSELSSMATTIQSGFEDNTAITGNLVQDLQLVKSKINYSNKFIENDLVKAKANVLTGFSEGGYTGNGGKYEIAGVVHKNEYVISSDKLNAIGGISAVENMVQRETIKNNTTTSTSTIQYSNDKSGIINQLKMGQETLVQGFNAMLEKLEDIIDYNNERREQSHSVAVSGSVTIEG